MASSPGRATVLNIDARTGQPQHLAPLPPALCPPHDLGAPSPTSRYPRRAAVDRPDAVLAGRQPA